MTQTYKVQVSMNQAHIVESGFVWKQGDFGFNIEIEVLDFDTTGATPQIIFRKSTGAVEATEISVAGNKFTYAIRGTELDTPGPCVCDLKLNDSTTKRVSTASFKYFVIPDTMDGLEQEASSYSDTIADIVGDLKNTIFTGYLIEKSIPAGQSENINIWYNVGNKAPDALINGYYMTFEADDTVYAADGYITVLKNDYTNEKHIYRNQLTYFDKSMVSILIRLRAASITGTAGDVTVKVIPALEVAKDSIEDISALQTRVTTLENGKVNKSDIANDLAQTAAGKVLDARQGKVLNDKIVTDEESISGMQTYTTGDYSSVQFTIPAGTSGNLNPIITLPGYQEGFDCYIDYDTSVYDGTVKFLSMDYTKEATISKTKGTVYPYNGKVYVRIYYDSMVKSEGVVVGGTITLYYRPSNSAGDKRNMSMYYIANRGNGVSWTNTSPVVLTLTDDYHYFIINGARITITPAQILTAAQNAGLTVSGKNISKQSYIIYYDLTEKAVKAVGSQSDQVLTHNPILFAAHYTSYVYGMIVDFINNRWLTDEINVQPDYSAQIAKSVADPVYKYIDFTIPAGQSETLNLSFKLPNNEIMAGVSIYYTANNVYSGLARVFPSDYSAQADMEDSGLKCVFDFVPRWLRLYTDNMAKDGQGQVIGGTIRVFYKYVESVVSPVVDDEPLKDIIGKSVPQYFKTNLSTAYGTIRNNMMEVGRNGETFIFITDLHWEGNAKNSPALVRWLLDRLNINTILCGGDLINQGTRDAMAATMLDCITAFQHKNILFPCAFGNHDDNWNDYGDQRQHPERFFEPETQYALMQKQAENLVTYFTNTGWNFYFDVENTKTRYITLDTGEDGTFSAYSDLIGCLDDTPSGYHIIIMAHWLYNNGKSESCQYIEAIIDAYNARENGTIAGASYDFTNADSEIFLLLGGHLHNDMDWTTEDGVPVVLTDTDSNRTSNTSYPFVLGTITEQAFDVITINYTNKTVKAVRIGRGADRTFARS